VAWAIEEETWLDGYCLLKGIDLQTLLPQLSFARILNLLEAACLDQWSQAEVRKHQKAWLRGDPPPATDEDQPGTAPEKPRALNLPPVDPSSYVDPDGSMGQPPPGLREGPVGYGL
jgi:hypothetical protein